MEVEDEEEGPGGVSLAQDPGLVRQHQHYQLQAQATASWLTLVPGMRVCPAPAGPCAILICCPGLHHGPRNRTTEGACPAASRESCWFCLGSLTDDEGTDVAFIY